MPPLTDSTLPTPSRSACRWILPSLLLLVYVLQCAWFIRTQSLTFDEPLHIDAGLREWREGSFQTIADHPPLGHLLPTFAVAHGDWQLDIILQPGVHRVGSIRPDAHALAVRTRSVNVVLGVLLGVLLWTAARKLFSEGAANLALALFAFSPSMIAHFSLVTTDGVAALMMFATALQLIRWRERPSWVNTCLLGAVLGLLLLAKMYTPPFFLLALGYVLLATSVNRRMVRRWNWKPAMIAAAVAFVVVWGGYRFHVSQITTRAHTLFITLPPLQKPVPMNVSVERNLSFAMPAGEYLYGLQQIYTRSNAGHNKYLMGSITAQGTPVLFGLAIALKWPTVVLALFASAILLMICRRLPWPRHDFLLTVFPVGVVGLASISSIALGERHILAAYPFVLLFAAATWNYATAKRSHLLQTLLIAAVLLNAADALRYAPDYLSYFNVFVSPNSSYKLMSDSNLDWGQGLIALRDYEAQNPNEKISLAYFGSVNPADYGVHARPFGPNERCTGTIVVSATNLSGQYLTDPAAYAWVTKYPLKTVLNHSLFVFSVPEESGR